MTHGIDHGTEVVIQLPEVTLVVGFFASVHSHCSPTTGRSLAVMNSDFRTV
jgi:hypothetical protein